MIRYPTGFALFLSALLLGGCATDSMHSKQDRLDSTLQSYAATLRWGDIAQGESFVDPKVREKHPPSSLDMARYQQVRVSNYDEQPAVPVSDNEVRQDVQIVLINVNTQSVRSIVDHQVWRYDETAKHWWLESGLPDISRQQ